MPTNLLRTASIEDRIGRVHQPLAIQAQEYHIEGAETDWSSFHTQSIHGDSPSEEFATLLDREHRINRLQSVENTQLRSQLHHLRVVAETHVPIDSPTSSLSTLPNANQRLSTAMQRNYDLTEECKKLHHRITLLSTELLTKNRQIDELNDQLADMGGRLNAATRNLNSKIREGDSYIVPSDTSTSVASVSQAIQGMNVGELNQVSLALGSAMSEVRLKARASTGNLPDMYTGFRRPISPFPGARPATAETGARMGRAESGAGRFRNRFKARQTQADAGADLGLQVMGSTRLASPSGYMSGDSGPTDSLNAKDGGDAGRKKNLKGKLSATRFWNRK